MCKYENKYGYELEYHKNLIPTITSSPINLMTLNNGGRGGN
jgi:hypothetical protein